MFESKKLNIFYKKLKWNSIIKRPRLPSKVYHDEENAKSKDYKV